MRQRSRSSTARARRRYDNRHGYRASPDCSRSGSRVEIPLRRRLRLHAHLIGNFLATGERHVEIPATGVGADQYNLARRIGICYRFDAGCAALADIAYDVGLALVNRHRNNAPLSLLVLRLVLLGPLLRTHGPPAQ